MSTVSSFKFIAVFFVGEREGTMHAEGTDSVYFASLNLLHIAHI